MSEEKPDVISREAHQRVIEQRDAFENQLKEAHAALEDFTKLEAARSFLMPEDLKAVNDQVTAKAELVMPHLRDVGKDMIPETLNSDRFKFLSQAPAAPTPDPSPTPDPATPEPTGGFGGPNPGGEGGAPDPNQKIRRDSPEFRAAVQRNDRAQIEKWYADDLVVEPVRPY